MIGLRKLPLIVLRVHLMVFVFAKYRSIFKYHAILEEKLDSLGKDLRFQIVYGKGVRGFI